MKTPLPQDYFKCPPLSPEAMKRYTALGKQSAETLIAKAKLVDGAYEWQLHKDESEIKIYKPLSRRDAEDGRCCCGVMQVVGEMDEYIELFRCDTIDHERDYYRRFGGNYIDAVLLHTVDRCHAAAAQPNDSTAIKWTLVKSPLDGLVARRDFVVLETNFEFKVDGKRGWVRSFRSIELDAFPDTRQDLGCVRGYMYDMGFVAVESDRPGYLDMTYLSDMDVKGNIPSWVVDLTNASWLRSMLDVDKFMRENRLSRTPLLHPSQLCPLDSRSTCPLCHHRFGLLRKKSNCVKCGEVVCRACSRNWNVKIDGHDARIRACLPCSLNSSAVSSTMWLPTWSSSTPEWLIKGTGWTLLPPTGAGPIDDNDDIVSVDLSNYADTMRDSHAQLLLLDIPSLREYTLKIHPSVNL
ncbi:hypothetical protein AeNC1_018532 [Aphanomyces euteiches]|nr:hypothetical protein AeNC1_018532 [Aphanomyces euteiches]